MGLRKRVKELEDKINHLIMCINNTHEYKQVPGLHILKCVHCEHRNHYNKSTEGEIK